MGKLRVINVGVSIDGFAAGPAQSLESPLGVGGQTIFAWFFPTKTFHSMVGKEGGDTGPDDEIASQGFVNIGASIMGRNMFGPVRGPWPDEAWRGWWGEDPPFHCPVFVLTHHKREPLLMQGGTTFHFITGGIHSALEQAREAAGDKDIRLSGGASTIRQYLEAGLVDDLMLAYAPVLMGSGEPLLAGLNLPALGYRVASQVMTQRAMHVKIVKGEPGDS